MPLAASTLRRLSSVLMKDGANVEELGVAPFESVRWCREPLPLIGARFAASDVDWLRLCEGGVAILASGDENAADLGLAAGTAEVVGVGEGEPPLAKGLFRLCDMVRTLRLAAARLLSSETVCQ